MALEFHQTLQAWQLHRLDMILKYFLLNVNMKGQAAV
jgi:hypothetical protein